MILRGLPTWAKEKFTATWDSRTNPDAPGRRVLTSAKSQTQLEGTQKIVDSLFLLDGSEKDADPRPGVLQYTTVDHRDENIERRAFLSEDSGHRIVVDKTLSVGGKPMEDQLYMVFVAGQNEAFSGGATPAMSTFEGFYTTGDNGWVQSGNP